MAGPDINIQMIGIDHTAAGVAVREQFAFTTAQAGRAVEYIKKQPGVKGCILLSTCNRMELWVSMEDGVQADLAGMLGVAKQVDLSPYLNYFVNRQSWQAVEHLFYLAAGFRSQILCEDQILTQVGEAAKKSREWYCIDTVLEVLFRHAVTAGKEVKTKVPSVHADCSTAHYAVHVMKQKGFSFVGKKCLVIGNGQMGKIAAQALQEEGALVTVTVRQYKSGMVEIPKGCSRIHYGERYQLIPECDVVVSATASPNLTIRKGPLAQALGDTSRQQVYMDLAVPRDMEKEIAALSGVRLYDIDDFKTASGSEGFLKNQEAAKAIIKQRLEEFQAWYECRGLVPRLQQIGDRAAEDLCWRMGSVVRGLPESSQAVFNRQLRQSSKKAVEKLLFALRDGLAREELEHCIRVLEKIDGQVS